MYTCWDDRYGYGSSFIERYLYPTYCYLASQISPLVDGFPVKHGTFWRHCNWGAVPINVYHLLWRHDWGYGICIPVYMYINLSSPVHSSYTQRWFPSRRSIPSGIKDGLLWDFANGANGVSFLVRPSHFWLVASPCLYFTHGQWPVICAGSKLSRTKNLSPDAFFSRLGRSGSILFSWSQDIFCCGCPKLYCCRREGSRLHSLNHIPFLCFWCQKIETSKIFKTMHQLPSHRQCHSPQGFSDATSGRYDGTQWIG